MVVIDLARPKPIDIDLKPIDIEMNGSSNERDIVAGRVGNIILSIDVIVVSRCSSGEILVSEGSDFLSFTPL
ncbi:MAG TPA: hypothetical protein VIJ34_04820 [Acidimicrobiales bacterium]